MKEIDNSELFFLKLFYLSPCVLYTDKKSSMIFPVVSVVSKGGRKGQEITSGAGQFSTISFKT